MQDLRSAAELSRQEASSLSSRTADSARQLEQLTQQLAAAHRQLLAYSSSSMPHHHLASGSLLAAVSEAGAGGCVEHGAALGRSSLTGLLVPSGDRDAVVQKGTAVCRGTTVQ